MKQTDHTLSPCFVPSRNSFSVSGPFHTTSVCVVVQVKGLLTAGFRLPGVFLGCCRKGFFFAIAGGALIRRQNVREREKEREVVPEMRPSLRGFLLFMHDRQQAT